jgi:hypothetical protein
MRARILEKQNRLRATPLQPLARASLRVKPRHRNLGLKLYGAQLLKRFVEVSRGFGEAEEFDPFDADLARRGLHLEDFHGLIDEVRQRHHARVGRRAARGEAGRNGRRDDFDDLNRRAGQLHSQGECVGVQSRLRRAVGGRDGQRHEAQAGGDVDDGRSRLPLQMRKKRRGQADRTEKVRGDDGLGVAETSRQSLEVFRSHDAGIIDQHVEAGMPGRGAGGERADGVGIVDVEV